MNLLRYSFKALKRISTLDLMFFLRYYQAFFSC